VPIQTCLADLHFHYFCASFINIKTDTMTLLVFAGLFVPIIVFGLSVYFFRLSNKNLKLLVAFSGAFLLSLTFNELIPQIYSGIDIHKEVEAEKQDAVQAHDQGHVHGEECEGDHMHVHGEECAHDHGHVHSEECDHEHEKVASDPHQGHSHGHGTAGRLGLFILLGFLIQLVLDYLTKGVEHGHVHSKCPSHEEHHHEPHKGISFIPVLIGLSLHSFLEGMPLASGFENPALQKHLLLGIVIHNIPIAIVFMSLLIQNNQSKLMAVVWLLVFAISGPLGVLSSDLLGSHLISDMQMFFKFSMAIVVGIFLHISTTILFETDENHRFNLLKFVVIIIGMVAAMIHF
jgi:zinc and cadmium transporter